MHFKINYIVSVPTCWNRDYVGNIEVNILLNIELRVKLSYVIMFSVKVYIFYDILRPNLYFVDVLLELTTKTVVYPGEYNCFFVAMK